ncbi:threonine synthase [Streptomyces sp. SBT349]|uniref:threonine synthase n=1 Tax=Streptomyces sp. SBT349 TaxID=1580539 RepID=UPI0007C7EE90|nr:pyridoxal-phosphate dependent enzyme [Streptomyces sp. SBT349]
MSAPAARFRWRCSVCGADFALDAVRYTCPSCPGTAALDLVTDYARAGAGRPPDQVVDACEPSMWRYRALLPVGSAGRPGLDGVGWTPLTELPRLARHLGIRRLLLKDDGRNLTGSLKDRASALVVAKARELGERVVVTASTGNAAAALAACCAASGVRCLVFVPRGTPPAKIAQLRACDAVVAEVAGGYGRAVELSLAMARRKGWYCRTTAFNPYTAEGKKTAALEIAEQRGWRAPDVVLVPAGDGNILTGMHKGFADALAMGWTDRMPRLIAVQSAAAPALFEAWRAGAHAPEGAAARSRAESINVAVPQDGRRALRAVRDTGGRVSVVSDEEAMEAVNLLARTSGVFAELASAVTTAALPGLLADGQVGKDECVAVVNTGSGLKDPLAALDRSRPVVADPGGDAALEAELTRLLGDDGR